MSTRRASSRGASTITSSSSSSSSTSTSSSTRASRRESRHDTALESAGDEDKHESTSSTSSMQVDSEEPLAEEADDEYVEQDPTRLTRLDEKSELQGLNKRLEFYILKQRERDASADAWGRELANLKNKHAADLEHQKNLFENQLSIVRKNRDELSAKLSKLEGESAHKDNLLSELQARLSSESKARSSLESRVESLSKELMLSQTSVHTLQNQLDNLRHEFAALQSTNKDLEKALDDSRLAHEQAQSKANKMSQLYSDLKDEYDTLQSRHAADAKKYDKQIHDLCIENNKSVESIRIECENRLNALFSERQYQYDKDKTDSLAELKSSYDAKLFGYRTRLEELGHELEGEKSAHRTAVRNLEKEMKYSESLRSEIAILQQRVSSLEKALAAEKSNPDLMKQLHEKNETIKRVKAAFKRKDAEFDELMDVKIMLDMEIKAYRSLLDQEDHRLNTLQEKETAFSVSTTTTSYSSSSSSVRKSSKRTKSSADDSTTDVDMTGDATEEGDANDDEQASKKRRRNSTGEAITATPTKKKGKQTEGKSKNSAVLFSRNDSTGEYVAMTNNSGQSASLKGWMLRAPRHDVTFTFPDVQLESGGTFYVVSGVEPKDTGSDDQIAHWPSKVEWDTNSEDIAELVAPSGAVVVTVVVAAKGAAETKKQKDQCTIM